MPYLSNERAKELSKLRLKKYRDEKKQVIVEGTRTIRQLITDSVPLLELFCPEKEAGKYNSVISCIPSDKLFWAEEHQISRIAASKTSQNILALVEKKSPAITEQKRLLFIDRVSDPGNVGAVFRTAKASGMQGIILSPESCDVFNPKTVRASVGAVFSLPNIVADYGFLKQCNSEIIVTDVNEGCSIFDIAAGGEPYILVIGSESTGIDRELMQIAHRKARIPMLNNLESLNVAVAAGLCMYHLNKDILEDTSPRKSLPANRT